MGNFLKGTKIENPDFEKDVKLPYALMEYLSNSEKEETLKRLLEQSELIQSQSSTVNVQYLIEIVLNKHKRYRSNSQAMVYLTLSQVISAEQRTSLQLSEETLGTSFAIPQELSDYLMKQKTRELPYMTLASFTGRRIFSENEDTQSIIYSEDSRSEAASSLVSHITEDYMSEVSSEVNSGNSASSVVNQDETSESVTEKKNPGKKDERREKTKKILEKVLSERRLSVILELRDMHDRRGTEPQIRPAIRETIRALLKDALSDDSNSSTTLVINQTLSAFNSSEIQKITDLLDSRALDTRKQFTLKEKLAALARISRFTAEEPLCFYHYRVSSEEDRKLAAFCQKEATDIIKSLKEVVLTPYCIAAINALQQLNDSQVSDMQRYHLICKLLINTTMDVKLIVQIEGKKKKKTVRMQSASDLLNNLLDTKKNNSQKNSDPTTLSNETKLFLRTYLTSVLNNQLDTLDELPEEKDKRDFMQCLAYVLNDLPRQVIQSRAINDLSELPQHPKNRELIEEFHTNGSKLAKQLKVQDLSPIREKANESNDNTPITDNQNSKIARTNSFSYSTALKGTNLFPNDDSTIKTAANNLEEEQVEEQVDQLRTSTGNG